MSELTERNIGAWRNVPSVVGVAVHSKVGCGCLVLAGSKMHGRRFLIPDACCSLPMYELTSILMPPC